MSDELYIKLVATVPEIELLFYWIAWNTGAFLENGMFP